jgi:hypothetical protein
MTHDEALFEALAYRRYVGGTVGDLRAYTWSRVPKPRRQREDFAALCELEEQGLVYSFRKRWYLTAQGFKRAKGWALQPQWETADASILLPVAHARTTSLEGILTTMDCINRTWPELEELHEGINRLIGGQLIKVKGNTFTATRRGLRLYAKVPKGHGRGALHEQDALWRLLTCPCCGVRLKRVRWKVRIDDAVYRPALASCYLEFRDR